MSVKLPFWALTNRQVQTEIYKSIIQLTEEVEKLVKEVDDLKAEVRAETEEDVLTAQQISTLNAKVDDLQAKLDEAQPLIDAAKQGESDALAQLEEVLQGVREATEELRADDPQVDNTLPNEIPVEGEPPVVDPR